MADLDLEPKVVLTFDSRPDRLTLLGHHGTVVRSGFFWHFRESHPPTREARCPSFDRPRSTPVAEALLPDVNQEQPAREDL